MNGKLGYVCRGPDVRVDRLGNKSCRMILEIDGKYWPCVLCPELAEGIDVGSKVRVSGEIMTREYLTTDFLDWTVNELLIKNLTTF